MNLVSSRFTFASLALVGCTTPGGGLKSPTNAPGAEITWPVRVQVGGVSVRTQWLSRGLPSLP